MIPALAPCLDAPPLDAAHICEALPALRRHPWHALAGGRVNQVWRVEDLAVKLHRTGAGSPLFPNDPVAEYALLRTLDRSGLAPAPVAGGPDWLVYRFVPGQAWRQGAGMVGALLARLHARPAPPLPVRHVPNGSAAILSDAGIWAPTQGMPPLPAIPQISPVKRCLLHGDPVPGNIVVSPAGAVLIDWQCPAFGDPVDDIALFLSAAMQQLYRGHRLCAEEIAAFRAGYDNPAVLARYDLLAPLLHWRIAAHCALRAAAGHQGYAAAFAQACRQIHGG